MQTQPNQSPSLWPLATAARFAGLTPGTLTGGVARGEIPLSIHRIGRAKYVNAIALTEWLRSTAGAKGAA